MSVILFPTHADYCKECMYHSSGGTCNSDEYNKHTYEVNCVWKYITQIRHRQRKLPGKGAGVEHG